MKVNVVLTNRFDENLTEFNLKNTVCAVIDVIRATSTITAMFENGAGSILLAENKRQALRLKKIFPEYMLCGEVNCFPPKDFDYGNSPIDILSAVIKNKNFILMTTNGTKSFFKVKNFAAVFALSILNLNYTVDNIVRIADENFYDILLLCSGEEGKIAYDDAYTAGLAVKYMLTKPYKFEFSDTSKLVLSAALSEISINNALEKSCSTISLKKAGFGNDIQFCSQLNRYKITGKLNLVSLKSLIINEGKSYKDSVLAKEMILMLSPC